MDNHEHLNSLVDITMPALGADMRDGTLLEWQIKPGDRVEKGDIIAVIETSKGAIDMESYHNGTISELLVEPEIKLPVGSVMARMQSDSPVSETLSESAPTTASPQKSDKTLLLHPASHPQSDLVSEDVQEPQQITPNGTPRPPYIAPKKQRTTLSPAMTQTSIDTSIDIEGKQTPSKEQPLQTRRASPVARKRAHHLGIDLSTLQGTGPKGAIVLRDLFTQASSNDIEPIAKTKDTKHTEITEDTSTPPATTVSPMRQAISDAMTHSKQQIPHYYLALEINLTHTQKWLTKQNQHREPEQRLLLPALLLTAIARQIARFPQLNGFYSDSGFSPSPAINIANTISLREGGLVTPAILNAEQLTIDQMMLSLRDLTERSRRGRLRSSEISQGTITVTSIGERGADTITGVIYPPQVAIIGLGRQRKVPVVNGDEIDVGEVMTVTLAADHRVSDGITGARFLHALAKQLQHPEDL